MSREVSSARTTRASEAAVDVVRTAQTEWSRVLVETLRHAGVSRVIASPGSRSTPILAAALSAGLEVHDVVDERAAAFVALGHARVSSRPVAVLCTSGTALAHWFPAVLEASLVGAPMVLVSADRPTELSSCGAAQTVDQVKIFGSQVRFFADAANPEADEEALVGLRRLVAQAVLASLGPVPGPVHLNVRARKPLEPREPDNRTEHALRAVADRVLDRPIPRLASRARAEDEELDALAERVQKASRVLLVAGPLAPRTAPAPILAVCARAHAVLAAEASSQLRFGPPGPHRVPTLDHLDTWLAAGLFDAGRPGPDLVVEIGGAPTSGAYERWVSRTSPARVVMGVSRYVDPHGSAAQILFGAPDELASALLSRLPERAPDAGSRAWAEELVSLDELARQYADESARSWGEPSIARTVAARAPEAGRIVVGNSLPIRMLDRYAGREVRESALEVVHQRGANGIDGLIAQSFGAMLAAPRPTIALLGDLTFLHDVGALAVARRSAAPLVVVVVDNAGGRIFESLPVAREAAWMMPHMVTSEPLEHEALARAFGVAFARASSTEELARALDTGLATRGLTLVHAVVAPHDARSRDAELVARCAAHLAERRERRWST